MELLSECSSNIERGCRDVLSIVKLYRQKRERERERERRRKDSPKDGKNGKEQFRERN